MHLNNILGYNFTAVDSAIFFIKNTIYFSGDVSPAMRYPNPKQPDGLFALTDDGW